MKLFSTVAVIAIVSAASAVWTVDTDSDPTATNELADAFVPNDSLEASPTIRQDLPDTTGAAIWAHLQAEDYTESWDLWPGTEPMYEGNDPHGMLLTTRVNEVALGAIEEGAEELPEGAIVVKRNYMPDGTLAAVTTMYKRSGFNPDHNDWFFAKHLPDGSLDQADMNGTMVPMEGRVPGCQNCHGQEAENDYIFTATLGAD